MSEQLLTHRLITDSDNEFQRIIAVDHRDVEIAGAYRAHRLNDWKVYPTKALTAVTGVAQPCKVHVVSREDAVRWLDLLAVLYQRATS